MAVGQLQMHQLTLPHRGMDIYTTFQPLINLPVASGLVPRWAA